MGLNSMLLQFRRFTTLIRDGHELRLEYPVNLKNEGVGQVRM